MKYRQLVIYETADICTPFFTYKFLQFSALNLGRFFELKLKSARLVLIAFHPSSMLVNNTNLNKTTITQR